MRVFLVLFSLVAAMASAADRERVSRSLEQRTGHALRAASSRTPEFPPGISLDEPLAADDAVAIALWNNAALEADLAAIAAARADLVAAGLFPNPLVSILFPVPPKQFELLLTAPIEMLWQRPRRKRAAEINLEQVAHGLVQNGLNLARDVRLAHADMALAQDRARITAQSGELRHKIAELTQRRLQHGDISPAEAALMTLDARMADDQVLLAARDVEIARERLRMLMGLRGQDTRFTVRGAGTPDGSTRDLAALVDTAMGSRPDLKAAELAAEAARQRAGWERSRFLAIAPGLSTKGIGAPGIRSGPALLTDVPVLNRNEGGISRAAADLERAALAYAALRDQVELEIRQSSLQLRQALESLGRARAIILPAVREVVQQAQASYRNGDISYLAALEASRQLYEAELREAEALAAVRRAVAHLERGVGNKL